MVSVFLVEDEPSVQHFYKEVLKFHGFEIAGIASNGEQAISMFLSFSAKPDIILMDYRMPIKNGIEASKEILKINKNSKIIFLSADESIKEEALSIGSFSFRTKPFSIQELLDEINNALIKGTIHQ